MRNAGKCLFCLSRGNLWGRAQLSNLLVPKLHCAALDSRREGPIRPAHITRRNAAFRRAEYHNKQRMGRAYLLEMLSYTKADAHEGLCSAGPTHCQLLAPCTPISASCISGPHGVCMAKMLIGFQATMQGSIDLYLSRGHSLARWNVPSWQPGPIISQTAFLYIELITDVCPILYHVP